MFSYASGYVACPSLINMIMKFKFSEELVVEFCDVVSFIVLITKSNAPQ